VDEKGQWILYRHILPVGVPNLSFNGFNSSLFCPLTADITSLWIAAQLESTSGTPLLKLPPPEAQLRDAKETAAWLKNRAHGKHSSGATIIPFSLSNIDEMLVDLDVSISIWARLREWILPVDPQAYCGLDAKVLRRKAELQRRSGAAGKVSKNA